MRFSILVLASSAAAFLGSGGHALLPQIAAPSLSSPATPSRPAIVTADCKIKGNVSINSGERIYHVPGQHWYDETRISPQHGERWFCTETEARAAGWRKAGY